MGNSLREITQEEYDHDYDEKKCYIKSSYTKRQGINHCRLGLYRLGSGIPPTEASIIIGKKAIQYRSR